MNTDQIKQVLKYISNKYYEKYGEMLSSYVCASDELIDINPNKTKECGVIINTDPSTKSGAHWQAVWFTEIENIRQCSFFDSYGQPPKIKPIIEFIKKYSDETAWNNNQVQGFDSTFCGEYCCLFILNMMNTHSYSHFYKVFKNNQTRNDEKVKDLFCKHIFSEIKDKKCNQGCMSYNSCK